MISRQEFPYLQQLVINDAYAVKNLSIPVFEQGKDFKHLILTGKNGSGKTTVLLGIKAQIEASKIERTTSQNLMNRYKSWIKSHPQDSRVNGEWAEGIRKLSIVSTKYYSISKEATNDIPTELTEYLFAFYHASRQTRVTSVTSVTREDAIEKQITDLSNKQNSESLFKQYLVNKKVFQVFDVMEGKSEEAKQQERFFAVFEKTLANIFEDPGTKLEFVRENFEFYINLSDGRRFTFNQLSAGFSAFLSILTELLMRTDLLRKQANDYTYDPCGFVLIDEPETHLHLEMQYQILPLLTSLFPNLQFIVATHSPAVASSITGATVFDLSSGEVLGDTAAGSSFSDLMQTHFGVENEYSNVADDIIKDIKRIVKLPDKVHARQELLKLLEAKGKYMSAGLRLEIETQLIGLE
ncbi:AAA family ATPase [Hymenobacter guriensis]|uniref:AAA family ATPase n=1 Tax=Hymenobacter guriensis TaxID=2793065 RepID=A0ABS0L0K7_9BACT|nr:AAA family ATPase [Hymenobacter guriensis]MBG8553640.1 AAA family ATPase [Hymenobacter guriensis]